MSGIDHLWMGMEQELRKAEEKEQRKMKVQIIAIAVVIGLVAGAVAALLTGCALMRPEACKRCNARPAVTEYKPHGDQVSTAVCGECAAWMGRKIRRKAVR